MAGYFDLWIIMVMIADTFKALTLCPALTYTVNLHCLIHLLQQLCNVGAFITPVFSMNISEL